MKKYVISIIGPLSSLIYIQSSQIFNYAQSSVPTVLEIKNQWMA